MKNTSVPTRANTAPIARHGRLKRSSTVLGILRVVAASAAVVLVSSLLIAGVTVGQLQSNINSVALVGEEEGPPPEIGSYEGGFNVLIVGSDECEKEGGCKDRQARLNDVNILVHVSEDQTSATAVSFPRDLIVPIPSCPKEDGKGDTSSMSAQQINVALSTGGLPCVVLTIEKLTGLDIPFATMITFNGVVNMSTAVGGVTVCTTGPVIDKYSGANIPAAGEWELAGADALGFLRSRHGVGDGSDLGRISSQQVFMSALVRKVTQGGVLEDPASLYRIATAATQSMTLSNSMKNVSTLMSMAQVFKNMPLERITFVQYPTKYATEESLAGKVIPLTDVASQLVAKIEADEPFAAEKTGVGSVVNEAAVPAETPAVPDPAASADPNATAAPVEAAPEVIKGLTGQSAAQQTCSKSN